MKLFLFTTDVELAQEAEKGGIYSVIVDWENKGKLSRQNGHDLETNSDTAADIVRLKKATKLPITVRINPVDQDTSSEVALALESGAEIIMLPMARSAREVQTFLEIVGQRAKTLVQIETFDLIKDLEAFSKLTWDFAYIGLNDLMVSRGGKHIWEPVKDGTVEKICRTLAGREYGFGGATVVDGGHPLRFELLLQEYTRLGCEISFMRRTFKREVQGRVLVKELESIHNMIQQSRARSEEEKKLHHLKLMGQISHLAVKNILVMYSTHEVSSEHLQQLATLAPGYKVIKVNSEEEALEHAPQTEVILGHRYLTQSLPQAKNLKWIQTTAAGVDQLPLSEFKKNNIVLTRCVESAQAIAQHAHSLFEKLRGHHTQKHYKNALILGLGQIGQNIAQIISKDMTVWGVKRQPDNQSTVDQVFFNNEWKNRLPEVDVVFLSLPHTSSTVNLLSQELLDRLPPHALIINVGRGETLNEEHLIHKLRAGELGGFATDVRGPYLKTLSTENMEKLPEPFIITNHVASHYETRGKDIEDFVEKQLASYLNKQPLKHMIDYDEY